MKAEAVAWHRVNHTDPLRPKGNGIERLICRFRINRISSLNSDMTNELKRLAEFGIISENSGRTTDAFMPITNISRFSTWGLNH